MTEKQKQVVRCAYADLCGALQARNQGDTEIHDWEAHRESIYELENEFPNLIEPAEGLEL